MRTLRRIAYWIAVLVVSAVLAYLLIRLAEGLDASQIEGAVIGAAALHRERGARTNPRSPPTQGGTYCGTCGDDPGRHRLWRMSWSRGVGLAPIAAVAGTALWWRKHPSACPYGQRFWLQPPHPLITRARLRDVLAARPGGRVLEVGPGTGYYTLDLAAWVGAEGRVDILDLQQEMLDHTMRRARDRALDNVVPTRGDASRLPYADASFDAAVLVAVLGEVPDQPAALRELARVLRPGGRVVVGELFRRPALGESSQAARACRGGRPQGGPPVRYCAGLLRSVRARARRLIATRGPRHDEPANGLMASPGSGIIAAPGVRVSHRSRLRHSVGDWAGVRIRGVAEPQVSGRIAAQTPTGKVPAGLTPPTERR